MTLLLPYQTSSGNITIDATANDTDIIFKGTDSSADITMLTLDGSAAGVQHLTMMLLTTWYLQLGDAGKI